MDFLNKVAAGINRWIRLNALLLACMVVMRPVFFLEVYFRVGLEPIHFFTILSGALFDLLLVCRIFTYGLIPFLVLDRFFPKTARGIFVGLILLYTVLNALLAEYYCNLTMPLDHVLLVYTREELMTTLTSSATFSMTPILWFIAQMALPVLLLVLFFKSGKRKVESGKRRNFPLSTFSFPLIIAAALIVPYNRLIREERLYPTHYDFCLAVNQPSYSFLKIIDYIKNESLRKTLMEESLYDETLLKAVKDYHNAHPEFDYDDPGYPFYRKFTETDVLGPYLNKTSDSLPPNFVFIMVEGLGRRLTGVFNPKLSFTPFIDSLAAEGLFWTHCLSTAERTFGVIPSVFASAPHGRYGFCTSLAYMPNHHSLLRDLEANGYHTAFYYGGDPSFDHYDFFMKTNHVDEVCTPHLIVADSAHYRLLKENHRWGLDDDQLVEFALQLKQSDTLLQRPFADIFLTLSTHEPFLIDGIERYEAMVKEQVSQTEGLSERERDQVMKNLNIFACYRYLDESLRTLFQYYASRPDFENTIFVITGDHRMAFLPIGTSITKYNVPLVVYSPLLRQHKTMDAVVSHLDITPTLNAYLSTNYDYAINDHCHWLGTTLDTTTEFRNTRKLLFMLNNRDVVDYYRGDYLINHNNLIRLDGSWTGELVQDTQCFNTMKKELDAFDLVSRYAVENDIMLPREARSYIYSSHLDFENNTLGIFDKFMVKDSGFLKVEKPQEFLYLSPEIAILPRHDQVVAEVSFEVRSAEPNQSLPVVVLRCGSFYETRYIKSVSNEPLNTGRWEHFHIRCLIPLDGGSEPASLKIYLWDRENDKTYSLDNLVIDIGV